jgi:charged multivesicular body protein 1
MTSVVRGMDKAMESMNLERISLVMDKFESQFADLDVQTSYMEDTMQSTTAVNTPQDQIDELMKQAAEEVGPPFLVLPDFDRTCSDTIHFTFCLVTIMQANIEFQHNLGEHNTELPEPGIGETKVREERGDLAERLRALRPAT